jgi:hypothetical protein
LLQLVVLKLLVGLFVATEVLRIAASFYHGSLALPFDAGEVRNRSVTCRMHLAVARP